VLLIELLTQEIVKIRGQWRLPRVPDECPEVRVSGCSRAPFPHCAALGWYGMVWDGMGWMGWDGIVPVRHTSSCTCVALLLRFSGYYLTEWEVMALASRVSVA